MLQQLLQEDKQKMDACWEACGSAPAPDYSEKPCIDPDVLFQMVIGREIYRSSTLAFFSQPRLTAQNLLHFTPTLLVGAADQHRRGPSRISWYSPCKHRRGAEWLFFLIVHASQVKAVGLPKECFRTTASVVGTH